MKKTVCIILILLLSLSLFSGCSGKTQAPEQVIFKTVKDIFSSVDMSLAIRMEDNYTRDGYTVVASDNKYLFAYFLFERDETGLPPISSDMEDQPLYDSQTKTYLTIDEHNYDSDAKIDTVKVTVTALCPYGTISVQGSLMFQYDKSSDLWSYIGDGDWAAPKCCITDFDELLESYCNISKEWNFGVLYGEDAVNVSVWLYDFDPDGGTVSCRYDGTTGTGVYHTRGFGGAATVSFTQNDAAEGDCYLFRLRSEDYDNELAFILSPLGVTLYARPVAY